MRRKPVVLVIRDGWGKGGNNKDNAIFSGNTRYAKDYEAKYPTSVLKTSGLSVGLPAGYQGNSEVGHLNIGAGRIVYQNLTRIDKSVEDGDFFTNDVFIKAIESAKTHGTAVHLMGLIQEEGVHAVTRHCGALLRLCRKLGMKNVLIHAITDGRDTPPRSAHEHMALLQKFIDETGTGRVATVIGRYFAMDRDNRWDRTELAYKALMLGEGAKTSSWKQAIDDGYAAGENDEFIKPRILDYAGMKNNDTVIFFNFRSDRTRQITKAMVEPDFTGFKQLPVKLDFVGMTQYYDKGHFKIAYPEMPDTNILGEVLARNGIKQLRCAETEKYAHVTFFFNGQRNDPFPGEERILVESPKVATYDLKPEMSAFEVRDKLVEAIKSGKYDVVITNFANGDMVGHTGVYEAILKAVETVDVCVHDVVDAALAKGGVAILMADHGNAEQTKLPDGSPMTAHTTNDVPVTLIGVDNATIRNDGRLCDIAPTILELLDIAKPQEMTGTSLIVK